MDRSGSGQLRKLPLGDGCLARFLDITGTIRHRKGCAPATLEKREEPRRDHEAKMEARGDSGRMIYATV